MRQSLTATRTRTKSHDVSQKYWRHVGEVLGASIVRDYVLWKGLIRPEISKPSVHTIQVMTECAANHARGIFC